MLQQIRTYCKDFYLDICIIFCAGTVRIAALLCFVWASKQLIDVATHTREGNFWQIVFLMIGSIITEILLRKWGQSKERIASTRMQNKIKSKLFQHLIRTIWQGREQHHSGDITNRLERDVQNIANFIISEIPSFFITLLQFCASFLFLFSLDHRIALLLVCIVPIFLLLSKMYYKKMKQLTHEVRQSESNMQAFLQESIQNKLVLKTHLAFTSISHQLDQLQSTLLQQVQTHDHVTQISRTLISIGFSMGYLTVFVYGAFQLQSGLITYGIMIAFLQLVGQIQRPIMHLTGIVSRYISAATALDRINELEQIPEEEQGLQHLLEQPCGIQVQNVSYSYNNNSRTVIHQLSCTFPIGSRTAIIGETGAGKTTLIRLLLALIKPQSGTIEIVTKNSKQSISTLTRCNFVYVPQGNSLISNTIRDNLLLGDPNASDQQINQVLHTACAEFVHQLPLGLNTICGEKGGTLSEGQAQRIAIARALLGKGNIILFDESTSAIDAHTETELMSRLKSKFPLKTLLFITHRLGIIDHCDQTLQIDRINHS